MAKEQTIQEKLSNLVKLQLIDSRIDEIQVLKGELPIEVSDLEDEIAGLEKRQEKIKEAISEADSEISKHKANIKDSNALVLKYEKQLDNVKNNREYDALTKEIELQKLENELSEKKITEIGGSVELKKESLAELAERLDKKKADLKTKTEELAKIISKTEKEEKKYAKVANAARENIETRLLKAYDKVRSTYRNGLSVVTIERDACGGCFNKIPPQIQLEISQRKKVIACEHCGRVLVDNDIMEEEKATV